MFKSSQEQLERRHDARAVYAQQGTEFVLMAFLLLILTLLPHWQLVDWSWR